MIILGETPHALQLCCNSVRNSWKQSKLQRCYIESFYFTQLYAKYLQKLKPPRYRETKKKAVCVASIPDLPIVTPLFVKDLWSYVGRDAAL